jgi:hypothetical protein
VNRAPKCYGGVVDVSGARGQHGRRMRRQCRQLHRQAFWVEDIIAADQFDELAGGNVGDGVKVRRRCRGEYRKTCPRGRGHLDGAADLIADHEQRPALALVIKPAEIGANDADVARAATRAFLGMAFGRA